MDDEEFVRFMQWALPQLDLRWQGFRKVRRQVRKRLAARLAELQLPDLKAYRVFLAAHDKEWRVLDSFCRITISRFYRDRVVLDYLAADVLPALALQCRQRQDAAIRVWSAGCASGEEPYTLALLWHFLLAQKFSDLGLVIEASDIDPVMIERSRAACYQASSLRNLPGVWREEAFGPRGNMYCLKDFYKEQVHFSRLDIRDEIPAGPYDLIFCRNLAFTYFSTDLQRRMLRKLYAAMVPGGILVTGPHEKLPMDGSAFAPWVVHLPIFKKIVA